MLFQPLVPQTALQGVLLLVFPQKPFPEAWNEGDGCRTVLSFAPHAQDNLFCMLVFGCFWLNQFFSVLDGTFFGFLKSPGTSIFLPTKQAQQAVQDRYKAVQCMPSDVRTALKLEAPTLAGNQSNPRLLAVSLSTWNSFSNFPPMC